MNDKEHDEPLLAALEGNVRRPTNEIAQLLGVSLPTAKRRIDRLVQSGQHHLGPLVDLHAAGFEYLLVIGIDVEIESPLAVALKIAELGQALTVNVVLGHCDIEVVAALRTRAEVSEFISVQLGSITGVAAVSPALALDVWKFQQGRQLQRAIGEQPAKKRLEAEELDIIACLQRNVRMSNRAIAAELALSESLVRSRIKRMQAAKQVCLSRPFTLPPGTVNDAFVGVRIHSGKTAEVCESLAALDEVSFVCTTLGRHDLICCIHVTELQALSQVLHEKIVSLPGVRSTFPSHCIRQVKHQSLLGLVL